MATRNEIMDAIDNIGLNLHDVVISSDGNSATGIDNDGNTVKLDVNEDGLITHTDISNEENTISQVDYTYNEDGMLLQSETTTTDADTGDVIVNEKNYDISGETWFEKTTTTHADGSTTTQSDSISLVDDNIERVLGGHVSYSSVLEKDADGNPTKETSTRNNVLTADITTNYYKGGELEKQVNVTQDSQGVVSSSIKEITRSEDGKWVEHVKESFYDSEGNLTKVEERDYGWHETAVDADHAERVDIKDFDLNPEAQRESSVEYEDGKISSVTTYDEEGKIDTVTKYDEKGDTVSVERHDGAKIELDQYKDGKIETTSRFFDGQLDRVDKYESDGKIVERDDYAGGAHVTFEYNENGQLEKSTVEYNNGEISVSVREYDENGKLETVTYTDENGKIDVVEKYNYEEDGSIRVDTYDGNGNFVSSEYRDDISNETKNDNVDNNTDSTDNEQKDDNIDNNTNEQQDDGTDGSTEDKPADNDTESLKEMMTDYLSGGETTLDDIKDKIESMDNIEEKVGDAITSSIESAAPEDNADEKDKSSFMDKVGNLISGIKEWISDKVGGIVEKISDKLESGSAVATGLIIGSALTLAVGGLTGGVDKPTNDVTASESTRQTRIEVNIDKETGVGKGSVYTAEKGIDSNLESSSGSASFEFQINEDGTADGEYFNSEIENEADKREYSDGMGEFHVAGETNEDTVSFTIDISGLLDSINIEGEIDRAEEMASEEQAENMEAQENDQDNIETQNDAEQDNVEQDDSDENYNDFDNEWNNDKV